MQWIIFEAGSRCGRSAIKILKNAGEHEILVVDSNYLALEALKNEYPYLNTMTQDKFLEVLRESPEDLSESKVFPADELTRQKYHSELESNGLLDDYSKVTEAMFDKAHVNQVLSNNKGPIKVPKTIRGPLIVKPNTMSAGCKGIQTFDDNFLVSERIDIKREFVIDCVATPDELYICPREVTLRSGYDKLIKFLPQYSNTYRTLYTGITELIIESKDSDIELLFDGIFMVQAVEDQEGNYWFIEASKRISGSSMVNLLIGWNPLEFHKSDEDRDWEIEYDTYYDFDYLNCLINE